MNTEVVDSFKVLVSRAMLYAQYSRQYLLDPKINDAYAIEYLNLASLKFATAESLYYSRFEELKHLNAKELFHLFDSYTRELINSSATNHSHRYTYDTFERLQECYENSVFHLNE